jgi:hypothetical protein
MDNNLVNPKRLEGIIVFHLGVKISKVAILSYYISASKLNNIDNAKLL